MGSDFGLEARLKQLKARQSAAEARKRTVCNGDIIGTACGTIVVGSIVLEMGTEGARSDGKSSADG